MEDEVTIVMWLPVEGDQGCVEAFAHPDGEPGVVSYVRPGEEDEGLRAPLPHPLDNLVRSLLMEIGHSDRDQLPARRKKADPKFEIT